MNKIYAFSAAVLSFLIISSPVLAAAPDGAGPWADEVVSSAQGLKKNGDPVDADRSNPNAALGVAENDTVASHFFSLGFGGSIVLRFDNPISNGVIAVEATGEPYPEEKATVELSADGLNWYLAGTVVKDGQVGMPNDLPCARFVKITDTTNPALHTATADGYDVDGVQAVEGRACQTPDVPEFGLLTGAMALVSSGGSMWYIKRKFAK